MGAAPVKVCSEAASRDSICVGVGPEATTPDARSSSFNLWEASRG
jgi:hypothetical protein